MVFKTNYHLMQVKVLHSAILWTFIKLTFVFKTIVLSIIVAALDRFYCVERVVFSLSCGTMW